MGIIAEVHNLHLAYFVDHVAVVGIIEDGRKNEHRVEFLGKGLTSSHERDESLWIVEHRPRIVPAVALGEDTAPLEGIEVALEGAVGIAASHQPRLLVENVAVVVGVAAIGLQHFLAFAQGPSQLIDAPVVVGIFQRAGHALVDAFVAGHVAQLVIELPSSPSRRRYRRVAGMCPVGDSLPEQFALIPAQSVEPAVVDHRGTVVAHHAVAMPGTRPFGQESALSVDVGPSFLHLRCHLGIEPVDEREERAERVPKACVGEQRPTIGLACVGAVVNSVALGRNFVEGTREEQTAIEAGIESAQVVDVVIFHLDASQCGIPLLAGGCAHFVEAAAFHFFEVLQGLLLTDE